MLATIIVALLGTFGNGHHVQQQSQPLAFKFDAFTTATVTALVQFGLLLPVARAAGPR